MACSTDNILLNKESLCSIFISKRDYYFFSDSWVLPWVASQEVFQRMFSFCRCLESHNDLFNHLLSRKGGSECARCLTYNTWTVFYIDQTGCSSLISCCFFFSPQESFIVKSDWRVLCKAKCFGIYPSLATAQSDQIKWNSMTVKAAKTRGSVACYPHVHIVSERWLV